MSRTDNFMRPIRRAGAWISKFVTPQNFNAIFIVGSVVLVVAAAALIYLIVTDDWSGLKPQWNMFKSWLLCPMFVIGLIISLVRWASGDAHYTVQYVDKEGNRYERTDLDGVVNDNCLVPFIMHFCLEPLMWAAAIYYPLMFVYSIIASIFPYLVSVIIAGIVAVYIFCMYRAKQSQTRDALVIVLPTLLTVIIAAIAVPMATNGSSKKFVNKVQAVVSGSDAPTDLAYTPYGITFMELGQKGIKQVVESDETPGAAYTTTYNFDEDGLLISKEETGNNSEVTYTYKYDANKQLIDISSSDGLLKDVTPKYENGKLVSVHQVYDGQGATTSWKYNKDALISEETSMYDESDGTTTTYSYKDGKLSGTKTQDMGFATITLYDENGLPKSYLNVSDEGNPIGKSTIKYEFDSHNNWTKKTVTDNDGEIEQILVRKYIYY